MSDENTTATESTADQSQTSESETLDDVYKKFNVDEAASSFQQQPQQQQQQQQSQQSQQSQQIDDAIPDPVLDPNGYRTWQSRQSNVFKQSLHMLHGQLSQLQAERMRAQEEADVRQAVSKVREKVGGELDDDFIEIALGQKARRDPKFLSIYQNRGKNPAAWNAALGAVANEFKGKFQYRTDSQLTENTRAAKQSTQTSLTTREQGNASPLEKRFDGKSGREFTAEWDRLVHGGH